MVFHANSLSTIGGFVRENPLVTGVTLAAAIGGTTAVVRKVRRRKSGIKKSTTRKRKRTSGTRKVAGRRKRKSHASPRHRGHKRVSFTTKDGKRVTFLVKPKQKKHPHR